MISYEYPLSERIRTLLRLEDLYERLDYFLEKNEPLQNHVALLLIFEIYEVASRADLKSDMLQELERQKHSLDALRGNPEISEQALDNVLRQIDRKRRLEHADDVLNNDSDLNALRSQVERLHERYLTIAGA